MNPIHSQVNFFQEGEAKKDINKLVNDPNSEKILKIWSQPSPQAKNLQSFGEFFFFVIGWLNNIAIIGFCYDLQSA